MEIPENPTTSLFQYRPPKYRAFKCLHLQTLHFTAPARFNDPYDCNVAPQIEHLTDEMLIGLLKQVKSNPRFVGHPGRQNAKNMLKIVRRGTDRTTINKFKRGFIPEYNTNAQERWAQLRTSLLGVVCLSKCHKNLLMWSHYAGHGAGFCLEFDTHGIQSLSDKPIKDINYAETPPDTAFYHRMQYDENEFIEKMLCHKSTDWKYEQEHRLFLFNRYGLGKRDRFKRYRKDALKAIYFGSETTPETKKLVSDILKRTGQNPRLFEGKRSHNKYELTFHATD